MSLGKVTLADNAAATTDAVQWIGGRGLVEVVATWAGSTIKVQFSFDDVIWFDVPSASFTANGFVTFELPVCLMRLNVAGGPPSAIYSKARGTV